MKAGIYLRISYLAKKDGTLDTLGIDRQEPPCRALVERLDGEIVDTYIDNDTSAWSGKRRKNYERMLDDLRSGRIDTIVAWQLDRFLRSTDESPRLRRVVKESGGNLMTSVGEIDLSRAQGAFIFNALVNNAEMESALKSERLIAKWAQKAERGEPKVSGIRPFGFVDDRIGHHPQEAKLIRDAATRIINNREPLYAICADWARQGVRSPAGKTLGTGSLQRLLLSPRMAGKRQHRGEVIGDAPWDGILTDQQQHAIREELTDRRSNRPRRPRGQLREHLLTGVVRCSNPECGRYLVSNVVMGTRRYVCRKDIVHKGCGKIAIAAETLEAFIQELVLDRLSGPELADMLKSVSGATVDVDALANQVLADELALAELERDRYHRRDASGRPLVSPETYPTLRDELVSRLDAARRALRPRPEAAVLLDVAAAGARLRHVWQEEWTPVKRRAVIRACLPSVVIDKGTPGRKRFDQGRIRYRWIDDRQED